MDTDDWTFVISMILIFAILMALVVVGGILYESKACYERANAIGLESQWSFYKGCLINVEDKWIPMENWRYVEGDLK